MLFGGSASLSPEAPSATSFAPCTRSVEGAPVGQLLAERLDEARVRLGELVSKPYPEFVSRGAHAELSRISRLVTEISQQWISPQCGPQVWSKNPEVLSAGEDLRGADPAERVTIVHERERTVVHRAAPRASAQPNSRSDNSSSGQEALRLRDGTVVSTELVEQLIAQLGALHDAQQGRPLAVELLGQIAEAQAECRALREKVSALAIEKDKRQGEVVALARELEGVVSALRRLGASSPQGAPLVSS